MSQFVDTNVFVRFITEDDPDKAQRSLHLFQRANRGDLELATSEAVVAEIVYVLASPVIYGFHREEIADRLGAVLVGNGIRLDHKEVVLNALHRYGESRLAFIDCLCIEHVKRAEYQGAIFSYDRDLDRIPGIIRLEP